MGLMPHLRPGLPGRAGMPPCKSVFLGRLRTPLKKNALLDVPSWDKQTKLFHQGQTSPGGPVPHGPFEMGRSWPGGKVVGGGPASSCRQFWVWLRGSQGQHLGGGVCLSELCPPEGLGAGDGGEGQGFRADPRGWPGVWEPGPESLGWRGQHHYRGHTGSRRWWMRA